MSSEWYFLFEVRKNGVWCGPGCSKGNHRPASFQALGKTESLGANLFRHGTVFNQMNWAGESKLPGPTCPQSNLNSKYYNDENLHWIEFPQLSTDLWDELEVYVTTKIEARHVLLFETGDGPFPHGRLQKNAWDEHCFHYRGTRVVTEKIDYRYGKCLNSLKENTDDSFMMPVTWKETVSEIVNALPNENGEQLTPVDKFRNLRKYASAEDIRILALLG